MFLAGIVVMAGIAPFALSQQGLVEPSMEIDMLAGQTQNPFRIQNSSDHNVFQIKTNGGFDPLPIDRFTMEFTTPIMDEIFPLWHVSDPATVITETAESGAGVYQFTYTVTEEDLDSSVDSMGLFYKIQQTPYLMAQMENTGAGAISVSWSVWDALNDIEIRADVTDVSVASGNFVTGYYGDQYSQNQHELANLSSYQWEAGDVIGLKIWTNTSGDLRLNKVGIIGVPTLETHALGISLLANQESGLGNNYDESHVPTCPFSAPTTCPDDNSATTIVYSGDDTGSNLFTLTGDEYYMGIGSVWYGNMWITGTLTETASDSITLINIFGFAHYPDSINVVTWK